MKLLNAKKRKSQQHIDIEEGLNSLIDGGLIKSWHLEIKGNKIIFTFRPIMPVKHYIIDIKL